MHFGRRVFFFHLSQTRVALARGGGVSKSNQLDTLKAENKSTRRFAGTKMNPADKKLLNDVRKRCQEQYPYLANVYESVCITDVRLPDNPIVYCSDEL